MKAIDFIFSGRPMLLLPVWSIYLISWRIINPPASHGGDFFLLFAGLSLVAMGAYLINQIFDYQSDLINRKVGFLQKGLISRGEMIAAFAVISAAGLGLGLAADLRSGLVLAAIFLLGLGYSVPPFRFKDRPVMGLLANGFGYGALLPLAIPGIWDMGWESAFSITAYFATAVSAIYLLTIIPDVKGDRLAGKMTLAAVLPNRALIGMGVAFLIFSAFCGMKIGNYYMAAISIIAIGLLGVAMIFPGHEWWLLFSCKFPILLLTVLAGYYFPFYLGFVLVLILVTRIYYKKRFGDVYPRLSG